MLEIDDSEVVIEAHAEAYRALRLTAAEWRAKVSALATQTIARVGLATASTVLHRAGLHVWRQKGKAVGEPIADGAQSDAVVAAVGMLNDQAGLVEIGLLLTDAAHVALVGQN